MQAQTITITFEAAGATAYTKEVTALGAGNMVDPTTGVSWSTSPDGDNPYVWNNNNESGKNSNVNTFGLMANYKHNGVEATVLSQLVINPTDVPEGDITIVAKVSTAYIGDKGNTVLRFKSATVNGQEINSIASVSDWGSDKPQPASTFYS
jgi:hypothetical protein